MKNYLVKARINFNDVEEKNEYGCDTPRKAGQSQWYCTKERYEYLKSHNAVVLMGIDEIKEEPNIIEQIEKAKESLDKLPGEKTFKDKLEDMNVKIETTKPKRTRKNKVVE